MKNIFPLIILLIFTVFKVNSQPGCPNINAGPDQTVTCASPCANLTATYLATGATTSYSVTSIPYAPPAAFNVGTAVLVHTDDLWAPVVTLPFPFCFYGTQYNSVVIGSNELFSFDATANVPGAYCSWPLTSGATLPTSTFPVCSIMGPYQDIDPTNSGGIYYQLIGTSPCRMLVVSFYDVPYFGGTGSVSTGSCPTPPIYATSMIVLYENTNVIEIYIQNKPDCAGWNGGLAIEGIQDDAGVNAAVVPGRNNTVWTATNDAWRFTPNGAPNYTISWWQGATFISNNATINVCPATTTTYTAQIIYTLCSGGTLTLQDDATVTVNNSIGLTINPLNPVICGGGSTTLTANSTDPTATFQWSSPPGGTSTSITVSPTTTTTYTVTATTTGCTTQTSATVTVSTNPTVTVNSPSICIGQSTTLTANGATSYVWNTGDNTSSITVSPTVTTTYTVTGSNSGCTGIGSGIVTVSANLVPTITGPSSICLGNTATLNAGGCSTYSWSNGANTQIITVSPTTSTTYTVTGTSGGGCTGTASLTVNVNPNPAVSISASANTICAGTSTILTATGALSYLWSGGLGTANPITVTPISTTTYTVAGIDGNGCTNTADITITPLIPPPIDAGPNVAICIGTSTQLNATGGISYTWFPASGLSSTTISNPIANPTVTTTYYASSEVPIGNLIINGDFSAGNTGFSSQYGYSINLGPQGLYYVGTNPSICNGGFQPCTDHTTGTGNMMIVNGATVPNVDVWCETISVTPNTNYNFSTWVCNLNNSGGPAGEALLQFSINGQLLGSAFSVPSVCLWSQFFSTWNSGSNTTATICIVNQSIIAVGNDFALDDISFSPLCTSADSVVITVDPLPNAQVSFSPSTCGLNNGSATATGGSTYLWSNGQINATTIGLAPAIYTVTVTSAAGCSSTASVTINNIPGPTVTATFTNENCGHANGTASSAPAGGTAPYTYLWNNSQTSQNITNLPASTYTVTVTDANSCTAVTSVSLINIVGPSLQVLGFVEETCSYGNGSATVNAISGVPPYSYSWSNGNTSTTATNLHAGTYTCTVTDANNCTAINSVTIANTPGPTLAITGMDSASCGMPDGSLTLNVNGGTPPYTYSWNSSPPQYSQNLTNVPAGNYIVTVTDANSCTVSLPVEIAQKPGPSATVSSTNEICNKSDGTATANATGGTGTYFYLWNNGENTSINTGLTQGNYTVTVSDGGCSTSVTVNVGETLGPEAAFTANPQILTIMDGPVTFISGSIGNIVNWQWNFGDNTPNGSGTNTTHQYRNFGIYLVTLIVTDNNGCMDTISDTIKIKDIFTLYIPNAFTPNGGILNTYFCPQGMNVDPNNFEMSIFDRWGNLVFHTTEWLTDHSEGWNGTKNNSGTLKDVVMDVYVYRIKLKEIDGTKHEYLGRITALP